MLKFLLILVALAGLFFMSPAGAELKSSAIDVVNPASAQRHTLGVLDQRLEALSKTVNSNGFSSVSTPDKIKQLNSLIDEVQSTLDTAQGQAESGDLAAAVSSLVRKAVSLPSGPQPTVAACPK